MTSLFALPAPAPVDPPGALGLALLAAAAGLVLAMLALMVPVALWIDHCEKAGRPPTVRAVRLLTGLAFLLALAAAAGVFVWFRSA